MENHPNHPSRNTRPPSRAAKFAAPLLLIAVSCAAPKSADAAASITYSGGFPNVDQYLSDGATDIPTDGSFTFALGAFAGSFTPTSTNTDQWEANWTPVTTGGGAKEPNSTTEFTTLTLLGQSYSGYKNTLELNHNNAPFTAGTQGYVWGYDSQTDPGAAQWILMTRFDVSNQWIYPAAATNPAARTWSVGNADTVVVGSIVGQQMTMGLVNIPDPVPEPSVALLCGLAATAALGRRRKPALSEQDS